MERRKDTFKCDNKGTRGQEKSWMVLKTELGYWGDLTKMDPVNVARRTIENTVGQLGVLKDKWEEF